MLRRHLESTGNYRQIGKPSAAKPAKTASSIKERDS
jgi:hypothetical protein